MNRGTTACCTHHRNGRRHCATSSPWPARFIVLGATLVASRGADGFTSIHSVRPRSNGRSSRLKRRSRPSPCGLQLSTEEEATPLSLDPPSRSPVNIPMDALADFDNDEPPRNDDDDAISIPMKAASGAIFLLLLSSSGLPSAFISTYPTLLAEYPLPTKSITNGVLCGMSDIIAQSRDSSRKEFNYGRLVRFAGKGCIGGIIWSYWYDNLDGFLNLDSDFNLFKLSGVASNKIDFINYQWIRDHIAIITTTLSILIEQFIWCPIVFGTFEIPISTLLNGGSISTIQKEVDSKLNGLLVSNAKVWTLANIVIYNAPVQWRPAVSSCVDLLWQSIVSDVAADCGKVEGDLCEIEYEMDDEKDFSFYAEKSRL
mmetsp:Transcript_24362/g.52527  ORF Transcript_24362/g.52527 Transcript_24362/m.52527 type:complete len:371 (-) Transcript_24362:86-1198(-)